MNRYKITMKHDHGRIVLHLTASSDEAAIKAACAFEGAPESAVIRIQDFGPVTERN